MKRARRPFTITQTTVERLAANGQIFSMSPAHPTRTTIQLSPRLALAIAIVCVALLIGTALLIH